MKRQKDDEMVQTAVRLPQSLRDRLSRAGGEGGVGEEIRRRLEASFDAERSPTNPKAGELADGIIFCADEIARDLGPWSEDSYAFAVLKETVNALLAQFEPPRGKAAPNPKPESALIFLFDDEPLPKPEKVSRYFMSLWTRRRAERADKEKRK